MKKRKEETESREKAASSLLDSSLPLLLMGLLLMVWPLRAESAEAFDPRALSLLERMASVYSRLKALDQRTEFSSALIPFDAPDSPFGIPQKPSEKAEAPEKTETTEAQEAAPTDAPKTGDKTKSQSLSRSLRLRYEAPNRLRLQMEEPNSAADAPTRYQWVSDGKFFWTTIPDKNWYTREKAPAHFADFSKLTRLDTGSLEMLMLLGVNPFANIREQCDRLTWEGAATVRDIATDVVALRSDSQFVETVAKLYIGHDDLLLRRVTIETTPIPGPTTPGKVGDALDDLADEDPNPAPALLDDASESPPLLDAPPPPAPSAGNKPMRTRVTYENIITTNPTFEYDAFHFTIPEGAWRYGTDEAPKGKKRKPLTLMRRKKRIHIIKQ